MTDDSERTDRKFKFIAAMPDPAKFLKNIAIGSGQGMLNWLGQLQGQIDHRAQAFFNSDEAIKDPRLIRFYKEIAENKSFSSDTPNEYLNLPIKITGAHKGSYLLTVNLILGCSSANSLITSTILLDGAAVFPVNPSIKISSSDQQVPISLKRMMTLEEGEHSIKLLMSRSEAKMFGSPIAQAYFGSIELLRAG